MENNNDIDDLFKEIIEPFEMSHSDKVWQSLENRLDKKENKHNQRVIFRLRVALGILLFVCSLFTYCYFLNSSKENVTAESPSSNEKIQESFISDKKKNILTLPPVSSISTEKKSDGIVEPNISHLAESSKKEIAPLNITLINRDNAPLKTELKSKQNAFSNLDKKRKSLQSIHATANPALSRISAYVEKLKTKTTTLLNASGLNTIIPLFIISRNDINLFHKNPLSTNLKNEITKIVSIDTVDNNETNKITSNVIAADSIHIDTAALASKIISPIPLLSKSTMDSLQRKQFRDRLSVMAYFSPDWTMKYLKDNDDSDEETETDYNNKEIPDFSFNTGILLGYDLTKNWNIKFGGTYAYLAQTVSPQTVYAKNGSDGLAHYKFNTTYGVSELPIKQNQPPALGDSMNINSRSAQVLQVIGIPVISKFQIEKKHFSYYAQLGLSMNFLAGESLIIQSRDGSETINKIEGLNEYYIGGIFGIGASYTLTQQFSILLEPTVRGALTAINTNTPVTTHPITYGLNFGISWRFKTANSK